jgi:hypothetical protein
MLPSQQCHPDDRVSELVGRDSPVVLYIQYSTVVACACKSGSNHVLGGHLPDIFNSRNPRKYN